MKIERWAHLAEIGASAAVVVSLLFLVQEVRFNTHVLERQAVMDRTAAFNSPFLADSSLASILVRIKSVDGYDPVETAFVETYDLTWEDAGRWVRHLSLVWTVLEADYRLNGATPTLGAIALGLLDSPDNRLFWEKGAPQVTDPDFRGWVSRLMAPPRTGEGDRRP